MEKNTVVPEDGKKQISDYPYNLLMAVKGRAELQLPGKLTRDILDGIHYVLSLLPEEEQKILQLRYAEMADSTDICRQLSLTEEQENILEKIALKKLHQPSKWCYIQHGIAGCLKIKTATEYKRGYTLGYRAGYADGVDNSRRGVDMQYGPEEILNLPIECMPLSTHAIHCLFRTGVLYIRDLVTLDVESICRIRGMGSATANEIARKLREYGIDNSSWERYIL